LLPRAKTYKPEHYCQTDYPPNKLSAACVIRPVQDDDTDSILIFLGTIFQQVCLPGLYVRFWRYSSELHTHPIFTAITGEEKK
jgi:hypothetical protein